jgi:hypothetical protein
MSSGTEGTLPETTAAKQEPSQTAAPDGGVQLWLDASGALTAEIDGARTHVHVRKCFPWSAPDTHLSLRDRDDKEVAHVVNVADLRPESRIALLAALKASSFVFEITSVAAIDEELEMRNWKATTLQGDRQFQTKLDEWPRALPNGGWLIRDVAADLYRIPPLRDLDPTSRKLLWPFVDAEETEG